MALEITQFGAFAILLLVMVLGEVIAKVTKGWVPSALVISLLLLAGFWTILPADLVTRAGITATLFTVVSGLLVANLGTLISRQEMAAQWKTVIIALMGIVSIVIICLTVLAPHCLAGATPWPQRHRLPAAQLLPQWYGPQQRLPATQRPL